MIDEGIVGIKLKKTFFYFYDTMSEVCQGYYYNQIDRIVSESLIYCYCII